MRSIKKVITTFLRKSCWCALCSLAYLWFSFLALYFGLFSNSCSFFCLFFSIAVLSSTLALVMSPVVHRDNLQFIMHRTLLPTLSYTEQQQQSKKSWDYSGSFRPQQRLSVSSYRSIMVCAMNSVAVAPALWTHRPPSQHQPSAGKVVPCGH